MWGHSGTITTGPTVTSIYADVQGTAHDGDFEFGHYWRRYAPLVEDLSVVGGGALHPVPASYSSVNLTGTGRLPIVDAGTGTSAELAAAGVDGKIALIRIADDTNWVFDEVFAARDAGAKAVVAYHEASGRWQPLAGSRGGAPASYSIPSEEAATIKERLAAGPGGAELDDERARARSSTTSGSRSDTPFTDAREFVVQDKKLGRTEATYQAMGVATDYIDLLAALDASGNGVSVGSLRVGACALAPHRAVHGRRHPLAGRRSGILPVR